MNNRIKFYLEDVGEGDYFVDELFKRIGLTVVGKTERGQGWQRCFLHEEHEGEIPISRARLTFLEGQLHTIHVYPRNFMNDPGKIELLCIPWMQITWLVYTGEAIDDAHINRLMATANHKARESYKAKAEARAELNRRDPKKRRALARPNPRAWLRIVMGEEIRKHLEGLKHASEQKQQH
jgi:hypothetical protein